MNRKTFMVIFGISLIGIGYISGTFSCSAVAQKNIQYKVALVSMMDTNRAEAKLNEMGTQGWEFVGIIAPKGGDIVSVFKK